MSFLLTLSKSEIDISTEKQFVFWHGRILPKTIKKKKLTEKQFYWTGKKN